MYRKVSKFAYEHFMDNIYFYVVSILILLSGVAIGCINGNKFEEAAFFDSFFSGLNEAASFEVFLEGLLQAAIISGVVFVFGLSPFGLLAVPFCVIYKGFSFGYTLSAVCAVYGFKSVVFILLALFPSFAIWILPLMFTSVNGIKSSLFMFRFLFSKVPANTSKIISTMLFSCVFLFFSICLSKLTEVFIIPKILNIVSDIYT